MSEIVRDLQLSPKQRAGVVAMMTTATHEAAARLVGVTAKTLRGWRAQPDFQAALTAAEADLIADATRRLLALQGDAIDRLAATLHDGTATPGVRLRAAIAILDAGLRLRELHSLEQRLAALEAATGHVQHAA